MNKRAEMGIGTLIIFIAMILVAAIAAGVLLQTASTLQNKALQTGERSKGQVSTTISPILLFGENGSTSHNLENFYLKAKLAPGSDPIKLSELLISFDVNNQTADLVYGGSGSSCTAPARNSTDHLTTYSGRFFTYWTGDESKGTGTAGQGNYTIKYLITSDNSHQAGYMQRGEVLQFCFEAPRHVGEDENIAIKLIPKVGTPTYIQTSTPDIITATRVIIYP